ncbi:hypothetical protein [Parapedobacter koreensis]|uniref:Uncharacterized protein n=1 Tax=Parapedobacter koreensis TaxID=332977 RepID=A0A1H7T1Q0_9SPHI|nr:hypothetical protein [Parapedobacter koreensis]SEL78445.1 hypothetical protein SAMN05421740_11022 [Parapedobacter koreensis]
MSKNQKVAHPFQLAEPAIKKRKKSERETDRLQHSRDQESITKDLIPKWYTGITKPSCDGMIW